MCYYRLWRTVLGCWLSGVTCRTAGYASRKSCNIPLPGRIACCPAPDPLTTSNQALHTIHGNKTHSLELLMMGIVVPKTCCRKTIQWHLVGFSSLCICNDAWTNTHQVQTRIQWFLFAGGGITNSLTRWLS